MATENDQADGLKGPNVEPNGVISEEEKGMDLQEIMRKVFVRLTKGHLKSLDALYLSALPSITFEHESRVFSIIFIVQRILEEGFKGGITVHKFGSFLTGLHCFGNESDLNLYIELAEKHNEQTLGELFDRAFDILHNANFSFIRKQVTKRSDWLMHSIGFFASFHDVQVSVNCCLGPAARRAWLSSKLILAYLNLWPATKHLALFVRIWAKLLRLNTPCYAGVSNYMFDLMVVHYLQQTGHLPVLHQVLRDELHNEMKGLPVLQLCTMETADLIATCKQISVLYYGENIPERSAGSLIYGFFRYYAAEFNMGDVCQITQKEPMEKDDRRMKPFSVRDPFTEKNVAKFRNEIFVYFQASLVFAARYLCMPSTPEGPIYNLKFQAHYDNIKSDSPSRCVVSDRNNLEPPSVDTLQALLKNHEDYVAPLLFVKYNFTNNSEPPVHCYICGKSHRENSCGILRSFMPSIQPLNRVFLQSLTNEIMRVYDARRLQEDRRKKISCFIERMQEKLRTKLGKPMLYLVAFGSLINGFAQNDCDLDLCLKLNEKNERIKEDIESTLSKVAEVFEEEGYKVEKVFNAKVKIVKFAESRKDDNGYTGDISISNSLAISNSVMLYTYCKFDDRVAMLGLFIKAWAKKFEINDASTGSISSYSYIVLMINYLQNCQEPVLPFLQEIAREKSLEKNDVEGWNATFLGDPETLKEVKKHYNNKRSVGELFYGFLKYYANRFNFEFDVVQIRSQARVTKLDKSWFGYHMCVEDPFELSRNLTGGVKMRNFMHFLMCLMSSVHGLRLLADVSKDSTKKCDFELDDLKSFIPAKFGCTRSKPNDRQKA